MGDFLRHLAARSLAQSFATQFLGACQPFQFALPTGASTEATAHALLVASFDLLSLTLRLQWHAKRSLFARERFHCWRTRVFLVGA